LTFRAIRHKYTIPMELVKTGAKNLCRHRSLQPQPDPIEPHALAILRALGEDPGREGLRATPARFARALRTATSGYRADIKTIVGDALFTAGPTASSAGDMVVVRGIELFSTCEHHLLPFYGRAHVAYIPGKKIIGLSKIPRIIDAFAKRLQLQERLTMQIAHALDEVLAPRGVAVVIEATHLCMKMRGVQKQRARAVTESMLGVFATDEQARKRFFELVGRKRNKC